MLSNILKIALRKLLQNKKIGLLYILCLGVGISSSLLLFNYYSFETSYDTHLPNYKNLYRVNLETLTSDGVTEKSSRTAPPVGQVLLDEFAAVEGFSRVVIFGDAILSTDSENVKEPNILLADVEHLNQFNYKMLPGSTKEDFEAPFSIIISEELSQKLYKGASPIGLSIKVNSPNLDGTIEFYVKGVFENIRKDSHLKPDVLISYSTLYQFVGDQIDQNWNWNNLYTYVELKDGTNPSDIAQQLNNYVNGKFGASSSAVYSLSNINKIHNDTSYASEFDEPVDAQTLQYLLILAIFVLVVTFINVINLYAGIASRRSKEVGVRKVSGAKREQLIVQFLTEAFIINLLGILVAITIIQLVAGYFESYFNIQGSLGINSFHNYFIELGAILLIGTVFTGFYPALIMSGWKVDQALNTMKIVSVGGVGTRRLFLLVQFAVSLFLIAGVSVVYLQIDHVLNYDLNINTKNKVVIKEPRTDNTAGTVTERVKNSFETITGVNGVSAADATPGQEVYWRTNSYTKIKGERSSISYTNLNIDTDYFKFFNIKLLGGEQFNPDPQQNAGNAIINESAAFALGFENAEQAVDKVIFQNEFEVKIIGVVEDFYQEGLKKEVAPTFYRSLDSNMKFYVIDYAANDNAALLAQLEKNWSFLFPDSPFEYFFLEQEYNAQYKNDVRFQRFFNAFCLIAILISCIGLVGISVQMLNQRKKEVGIRKVLGASVSQMLVLLTNTYFKMAMIAHLIAMPLAYILFQNWLNEFVTQITLGVWFFAAPIGLFALIILITISSQVYNTANKNPVDSLRYE
ncbi:ABC transporter permease [Fulvivirga sp.]|uniref:ABC transporter permease n=1 Tax=Fulvivirga sp. TaxID=1931237 RepID=UPI0032EC6E5C